MGRGLEDTLRFGPGGVAASDPIPTSADQFLVVGAEEGIYTLNLHELHEDTLEKVRPPGFWGHTGTGVLGAEHLGTVWPQLISQRCSSKPSGILNILNPEHSRKSSEWADGSVSECT